MYVCTFMTLMKLYKIASLLSWLYLCVQEIQEHIMHNSVCIAYTHCNTYVHQSQYSTTVYPLIHTQGGYNAYLGRFLMLIHYIHTQNTPHILYVQDMWVLTLQQDFYMVVVWDNNNQSSVQWDGDKEEGSLGRSFTTLHTHQHHDTCEWREMGTRTHTHRL